MNYSAINIQGNIVSSEILEKIRTEDIRFQKSVDFGLAPSALVRDEINLAWNLAVSNWNAFKIKRELLKETDTGTAETRRYWMLPLLQVLGYEVMNSNAEIINGKTYAISHRASNRDGFPLHIVGVNQSLDKRAEQGGTRLSPHALAQEYLNNTEHTYGLISNGRFIRVLRDATRLSKLSYLEFDLEQILEEGLFVEFALMYRVLHASRMPEKQDSGAECFLEFYHQEALASGSRIRERLSVAVENSIKELANGFLRNPNNQELRESVLNHQVSSKEYYLYTLRLVYRVLFLLVIEERKLIYPEKRGEELDTKRSIYYQFYSIQRLTKLAEKLIYVEPRKTDLWQSLITTFALFEEEQYGKKLGISPLGAGIFSPNALGILGSQFIDNETLLRVLRYLVTFENEQGQRVRVNYADLDVEEFGSVYEGLLDYDPEITNTAGQPMFGFVKGDDRSSSGSHYTPEELVRPLIKHSLDYLIEDKLKEADPEKGLLSLTICDVACGSGHILLSAARRVGFELAKVRSKEDQPTPSVLRVAVRDVIRHCIYGVDLNPLAVELCKVALWLEAHEPGEPLNFLDHHIKCGNAIVGLAHAEELEKGIASEAFKTLPGDEKEVALSLKKQNEKEIKMAEAESKSLGQQVTLDSIQDLDNSLKAIQQEFVKFSVLPENTTNEIEQKEKVYRELTNGKKWWRLKQLADLQVAQFFIPKTQANKEKFTTHGQYRMYLKQGTQILDRGSALAISAEKRFFHWFLEFPEVFQRGGFDCILGNPPYLGGSKISSSYGVEFANFLSASYEESKGMADFVTYFFKRDFELICKGGFISLLTTDSISQGITRESSLDYLLKMGSLNFAIKSIPWPGIAAVNVSIVTFFKGKWHGPIVLNNNPVSYINSLLDEGENIGNPFQLMSNSSLIFTGSKVYGEGFVINSKEREYFISSSKKNIDVIFPYLSGDDIAKSVGIKPEKYVINFRDWNSQFCEINYPEPFWRIAELVRPERQKLKGDESAKNNWWQYQRIRKELYDKIKDFENVIVIAQTAKYILPTLVKNNWIYSVKVIVFSVNSNELLALLNSSIHNEWVWKYSTTMGSSTIQYSTSQCFENFPLPSNCKGLEQLGNLYQIHRTKVLSNIQYGLTKGYNLFHDPALGENKMDENAKQITALKNHLNAMSGVWSFNDAIVGVIQLRDLHRVMDEAVLEAYGWHRDDPKWGKAIQLRHDFYEVDYLPENDRVRYTIHPEARKEVLKRLLQLNHERYAEEVAAGLHDKKAAKSKTASKKGSKAKKDTDEQEELF
jgi:methylase of polypeptide subunit release factors